MPHPTPYDIDLFVAGEQPPAQVEAISSHLDSCPSCRTRVEMRLSFREEMLARRSAAAFARQTADRALGSTPRYGHWAWRTVAPALAAATLIAIGVLWFPGPSPKERINLAWRGRAPAVDIYVNRENEVSKLGDRTASAGDELRYGITMPPGTIGHAAVFVVESGRALPLLPPAKDPAPIRISGNEILPGSVEITEGGGAFVLVLVVRSEDYPVSTVVRELEAAAERGGLAQVDGVVHQLRVTP